MATVNLVSYKEQNAATLAGAQAIATVYVGTNITADQMLKWGTNAPLIRITGAQTASLVCIGLDTANATHGAGITVTRQLAAPGTAVVALFSGAVGTGYAISTAIAVGTGNFNIDAAFDGVAGVWR